MDDEKYYIISIKWTYKKDFAFNFWGPNNLGYSRFKKDVGLYDYDKAFSIAGGCHFDGWPVPQSVVDSLWVKAVYEPRFSSRDCHIVINCKQTRELLRINPFSLQEGERMDYTNFLLLEEPGYTSNGGLYEMEEYKIIKTNWWSVYCKDPQESHEFGEMFQVEGATYKEARKEAYKEVNSWSIHDNFLEVMDYFKIERIKEKVLINQYKTWEKENG